MSTSCSAEHSLLTTAVFASYTHRYRNYPVQEHLVRTQDNYLLGVHRITHGREKVSSKGKVPNPPEDIVKLLRENGVPLAAETKEAYLNKNKRDKRDQEEDLEADLDKKIRKHTKEGDYIKPVVLLYHGFMMCSEVWLCNLEEERNLAFVLAEAGYVRNVHSMMTTELLVW